MSVFAQTLSLADAAPIDEPWLVFETPAGSTWHHVKVGAEAEASPWVLSRRALVTAVEGLSQPWWRVTAAFVEADG